MPPSSPTNKRTVSTVERAVDLLVHFTHTDRPDLGVTELANELALSKTVVHRLLTTLTASGFVSLDERTRRYRLGPAVLALGTAYLDRLDLRKIAEPSLRALSEATQETATLSLRHGNRRFYVDQVTPAREVKMTVALGEPFPLHAGSSSKAFLAFLTTAEREAYIGGPLEAMTAKTITDADSLRRELDVIGRRGWARSLGERQPGAASVAAPVLDHRGRPVAVLSVCGPEERFGPHVEAIVEQLLSTTRCLSSEFGFASSPAR